MTVPHHPPGTGPGAYLRDMIAGSLRHGDDINQILLSGSRRWTDALLSEARVHLFGCLNAVELALGVHMEGAWLARPVEALGPNYCRSAIERHPAVLSPLLVDHLRQRAAAALTVRMTLMPSVMGEEGGGTAPSISMPQAVSDSITALRLAVDPWFNHHPIDLPMRADLAAEPFCDLVWTATALLVEGLAARMGVDGATAAPILARAAQAIIARHDEHTGPFARAAYVAALVRNDEDVVALAEEAVLRHDLLLLAALGGARTGIVLEQALTLLIDGSQADRAAFVRQLSLNDTAYVALLDVLGPIHDLDEEPALPDLLTAYRLLDEETASNRLARWCGPVPLMDKLARMGWSQT